jgi:hypothetical protein
VEHASKLTKMATQTPDSKLAKLAADVVPCLDAVSRLNSNTAKMEFDRATGSIKIGRAPALCLCGRAHVETMGGFALCRRCAFGTYSMRIGPATETRLAGYKTHHRTIMIPNPDGMASKKWTVVTLQDAIVLSKLFDSGSGALSCKARQDLLFADKAPQPQQQQQQEREITLGMLFAAAGMLEHVVSVLAADRKLQEALFTNTKSDSNIQQALLATPFNHAASLTLLQHDIPYPMGFILNADLTDAMCEMLPDQQKASSST